MTTDISWFESIARDARRYSVVFLHLGHAFAPYRALLTDIQAMSIPVAEYLSLSTPHDDDSIVVISDVHSCIGSRHVEMGSLRSRVLEDIDVRGHKFVLVSEVARAAFPTVVGSDLLANAKHVFIQYQPIEESSESLAALPGWSGGGESPETFLATCVSELSAETVVTLGELIWDLGLSPNECLHALGALDRESLRGAGLLRLHDDELSWVLSKDWKAFRAAIAVASSRYMTRSDWLAQVFVDLWLIERQVRNAIRDALVASHGSGWRSVCAAGDMALELVSRAKKDVQPRAEQLKDLRDPLEWLTTSELLDLRESRQLGELGLEAYMWTKLRVDLLPIRNRAAHMRVVSERDARTVATWRKIVMAKLCPGQ